MTTTTYEREIVYDRETHDYAMYLNGELVGFGRTYADAERTLDELVYELLGSQQQQTIRWLEDEVERLAAEYAAEPSPARRAEIKALGAAQQQKLFQLVGKVAS